MEPVSIPPYRDRTLPYHIYYINKILKVQLQIEKFFYENFLEREFCCFLCKIPKEKTVLFVFKTVLLMFRKNGYIEIICNVS